MIKKVIYTVPWTYVTCDLNVDETVGTFSKKELQKTNRKEFRVEKVIKIKSSKLCIKRKGYDNFFNNWIDNKYFSKRRLLVEM